MSQNHSALSNPTSGERVPPGTLVYFRVRNRQHLWQMLVTEFERSGITQAELAYRIGRDPSRVNTLLSTPSNIEIDTYSDYLFGISGAQPTYGITYPLQQSARNYCGPDWIVAATNTTTAQSIGQIELLDARISAAYPAASGIVSIGHRAGI